MEVEVVVVGVWLCEKDMWQKCVSLYLCVCVCVCVCVPACVRVLVRVLDRTGPDKSVTAPDRAEPSERAESRDVMHMYATGRTRQTKLPNFGPRTGFLEFNTHDHRWFCTVVCGVRVVVSHSPSASSYGELEEER